MKKLFVRFGILMAGIIGIGILTNVIMLSFHDLSYYYQWPGIGICGAVSIGEYFLIGPVIGWYCDRFLSAKALGIDKKEES